MNNQKPIIQDDYTPTWIDIDSAIKHYTSNILIKEYGCRCGNIIKIPVIVTKDDTKILHTLIDKLEFIYKEILKDYPQVEKRIFDEMMDKLNDSFGGK